MAGHFMKLADTKDLDPLTLIVKHGELDGISYVNYHRYEPGERHEEHVHDDREEIFVCLGGKGVLTGRERSRISGGVVIVVLPGEPHGFESEEEDPLEYVCIGCRISPKP
jgi:mannose-6-phosphate isomerase-like protein (cupin superfamily)